MSKEFCSALKGSGVGAFIGIGFGFLVLSTMGFDRITFFEGLVLISCATFGGVLFGSLIGVTGAFRRESSVETEAELPPVRANITGAA